MAIISNIADRNAQLRLKNETDAERHMANSMIDVDDIRIMTDGGALDAETVLRLSRKPGDSVVIRLIDRRAIHFNPLYPMQLERGSVARFRCFPGGGLYQLEVVGTLWDWGAPAITVPDLHDIACYGRDHKLAQVGGGLLSQGVNEVDLVVAPFARLEFRSVGGSDDRQQNGGRADLEVDGRTCSFPVSGRTSANLLRCG